MSNKTNKNSLLNQEGNLKRFPLLGKEVVGVVCFALVISQLVLVILSWLLSAMRLEGVRSLLSSEGIRWFIGSFSSVIGSPLLACIILCLIALGALQKSGFVSLFTNHSSLFTNHHSLLDYRSRVALRVSLAFLVIYIAIICLLTLMPHAILLSATGSLFPSAVSRALVPIIALGVCLVSLSFGMVAGHLRSPSHILSALTFGIEKGAPIIILYLLAIQLYASLRFVFMF